MAQDDDGKGFLTRLLQDSLSGAGREVQIDGFRGALSSRAALDRMTIADEDGVWLELTGAELDWNRSALLRGRLEVTALTAESLNLVRLPRSEESAAEASGFAIPDLPVSVDVGRVAISDLRIGRMVMGEPAQFTFEGNAQLDGQALAATLSLVRRDREGQIGLVLDLRPDENQLVLDLNADEPAGGIAARLLDLPGQPALSLSVDGEGPLDDFTANVALSSDGEDRLAGTVTLRGQADGAQAFAADLGGDLTALLLPQAREFLGQDIRLVVDGRRTAEGTLALDQLSVDSASLKLDGSLATAPDGRPSRFDLTGEIAAPDGAPVVLPFGDRIAVRQATVSARFDASVGDGVTAEIAMTDFSQPGIAIGSGALTLSGTIATEGTPSVDLALDAGVSDVAFEDAGLQEAFGPEFNADAGIRWTSGADLTVTGLNLRGTGYGVTADATLTPGGGTSILTADGRAAFEDLSRLATLSGTQIRGAADVAFDISADLLGGSFALSVEGGTTDLALGIDRLDPVIGGDSQLVLNVARGPEGIALDGVRLSNNQIRLEASGEVGNDTGRIAYAATLRNSGAFMGVDGGPVDLTGTVVRDGGTFTVTLDGGGRDIAVGIAQADELLKGRTEVSAQLTLNDRILLDRAAVVTPAMDIRADGELTDGARQVRVTGRLNDSGLLTGADSGPVGLVLTARQDGADYIVDLDGTARDLAIGVAQVDGLLAGETRVTASASIGERILLERATVANPALTAEAEGELTEGRRDIRLSARLADSGRPLGGSGGPLTVDLRAVQDGAGYQLTLDGTGENIGTGQALADSVLAGTTTIAARGRVEGSRLDLDSASVEGRSITAQASGVVASGATSLDFSARLASLSSVVPQAPAGPLSASGRVRQGADGALDLAVTAEGPGGTTARIDGRALLPGGAVDLAIAGTAPLALANPYITPRSVTGTAQFDLTLSGQPGPDALRGRVTLSGGRFSEPSVRLAVEDIAGAIDLTGGAARLDLRAAVNGGAISLSGPVGLSAPYSADLTAALTNVPFEQPGLVTTRLNGQIAVRGGLTGGGTVSGRVGLTDTEMRIPDGGFGGVEPIPDMRHVNEPAASRTTRARAGLTGETAGGGGSGGGGALGLDVQVVADSPIFVRGRGVDAELRGGLLLEGTTSDVRPIGQFDLVRGRIDILTKRLDLTDGQIRLAGGFDPIIRLVAESASGEYVIQIALEGPAAQPSVVFSSRPELPEDEVLAQLFFERDIGSLTPFQAARLALAVAELTGRGNGGIVGRMRDGAGLDDLDVSTTAEGETALSAGKYINENVYTEVEATSGGKTSLSINLDVTRNLTAKGRVGSDGDSSVGLFFEKDY
jgi:translocation and assembly module TamB